MPQAVVVPVINVLLNAPAALTTSRRYLAFYIIAAWLLVILRKLADKGSPIDIVLFPNAEHGIIAVEQGPGGRRLAGRTAEGYFELLTDWIIRQAESGDHGGRR